MRGMESIDDAAEERHIDLSGGRRHAHFHRLSGVTHIGFAGEPNARTRDAIFFQCCRRLRFEIGIERGDCGKIGCVFMRNFGHDLIGAPIDREQSKRGKIAGIGRYDAGLHADQVHHRR